MIVGSFRTFERVGTAAGAVTVGAIVTFVGYGEAMLLVGALVIVCTGAFAFFNMDRNDGRVPA